MLSTKDGNVTAVIWNFEQPDQKVSNRSFYTKVIPSHPAVPVHLRLTHLAANVSYHLVVHRTGFHSNDAYTAYIELGSPQKLTEAQVAQLSGLTRDLPEMDKVVPSGADGTIEAVSYTHLDVYKRQQRYSQADCSGGQIPGALLQTPF